MGRQDLQAGRGDTEPLVLPTVTQLGSEPLELGPVAVTNSNLKLRVVARNERRSMYPVTIYVQYVLLGADRCVVLVGVATLVDTEAAAAAKISAKARKNGPPDNVKKIRAKVAVTTAATQRFSAPGPKRS